MADTVEALLEENLGKLQDFLQSLEKLKDDTDVSVVDEWFVDAESKYSESVEKMWTASQVLGVLDQALETSEQEIETKLKQLEDQCDEIEEKVQATDKSTDQIFAALDSGAAKLENVLDLKYTATEKELTVIRDSATTLKTLIDTKMDELMTSTNNYVGKADEAFGNLETRLTNIVNSLNTFETKGGQLVDGGKQAMETAIAEIKEGLDATHASFAEAVEIQIEQAAAEEAAKIKEEVQGSIAEAKEQVQAANLQLQEAKNAIETEAAEVESKAEQVVESIGEADSSLDDISKTL